MAILKRVSLLCSLVLLCGFVLPGSTGSSATLSALGQGTASGVWLLPFGSVPGFVDGKLLVPTPAVTASGPSGYHFTGALTATTPSAFSMIEGQITGTLDDGVGPGPDYWVVGTYLGTWATGAGSFSAVIVKVDGSLSSAVFAGSISGTFKDSPATLSPGTFSGRWKIGN